MAEADILFPRHSKSNSESSSPAPVIQHPADLEDNDALRMSDLSAQKGNNSDRIKSLEAELANASGSRKFLVVRQSRKSSTRSCLSPEQMN